MTDVNDQREQSHLHRWEVSLVETSILKTESLVLINPVLHFLLA